METETTDVHEIATSSINPTDVQCQPVEGTDDKTKSTRHPRWTRQETLVLIEGKKFAENRGRKGRRSSSIFGTDRLEPKWDMVSSHCRQHGVSRGPIQCRKRWSNLVSDFKKIKVWESEIEEETKSYWMMRKDLRKEKKLPTYFDREVYDVMEGKAYTTAAYQWAIMAVNADEKDDGGNKALGDEDADLEEVEVGIQADSDIHPTSEDSLHSDFEQSAQEGDGNNPEKEQVATDSTTKNIPAPIPISERRSQPVHQVFPRQGQGQQVDSHFWRGPDKQEEVKRRRVSADGDLDSHLEQQLIKVVEMNTMALNAQLESLNRNSQLEREHQKDQNNNLVAALSKISDALSRIADKF